MFKRLIDWVRWYFSEEERQTRQYAKARRKIIRELRRLNADNPQAKYSPAIQSVNLDLKYPKSRQATARRRQYELDPASRVEWGKGSGVRKFDSSAVLSAMRSRKPFVPSR